MVSACVGDVNVSVNVNGTTFVGIFEVSGRVVELTSFDFGTMSRPMDAGGPLEIAERMLRQLALAAIQQDRLPFLVDPTSCHRSEANEAETATETKAKPLHPHVRLRLNEHYMATIESAIVEMDIVAALIWNSFPSAALELLQQARSLHSVLENLRCDWANSDFRKCLVCGFKV